MGKWQPPRRRAQKYGPVTIQEAQIAVFEVLERPRSNTAAFRGCYEARAAGRHIQNRWKTDPVEDDRRKSEESAVFQWSNKLYSAP